MAILSLPPTRKITDIKSRHSHVYFAKNNSIALHLAESCGKNCYQFPSKVLTVKRAYNPRFWRLIPFSVSRFKEGGKHFEVRWLDKSYSVDVSMLLPSTKYGVNVVFKLEPGGFQRSHVEAVLGFNGREASKRRIILHREPCEAAIGEDPQLLYERRMILKAEDHPAVYANMSPGDQWLEVELGEINTSDEVLGSVNIRITRSLPWKHTFLGLLAKIKCSLPWKRGISITVEAIEIHAKD